MTSEPATWMIEDGWTSEFDHFLIDDGKIWYSFRSRSAAEAFRRSHFMTGMLLIGASQVPDVLMTEPHDYRAWRCKSPVHVIQKTATEPQPMAHSAAPAADQPPDSE